MTTEVTGDPKKGEDNKTNYIYKLWDILNLQFMH